MTEAGHVSDLMTRMALSHPRISFQFINNGQSKLHTSGNGNLRDVIYHIYGREIAANLINVTYEKNGIRITGYIGAPLISRGNRNFETYFINGRYVKSSIIYKAIEDAYKDFTMQHKYPFTVLHIEVVGEDVDVNVHPTKMEVRFHNQQMIYNSIYEAVDQALHEKELIPEVTIDVPKPEPKTQAKPEPNYEGNPNTVRVVGGTLVHYTIAETVKSWQLNTATFSNLVSGTVYYIYARCQKTGTAGNIVFDTVQRKVDSDPTYYYFLVGSLSSAITDTDGKRPARLIALTYGATTINGRFLTTGRIQSGCSVIRTDRKSVV